MSNETYTCGNGTVVKFGVPMWDANVKSVMRRVPIGADGYSLYVNCEGENYISPSWLFPSKREAAEHRISNHEAHICKCLNEIVSARKSIAALRAMLDKEEKEKP